MSNSNLVSYVDLSSGKCDIRKNKVSRITIHQAEMVLNDLTYFSTISRDSGKLCSWNYAISNKGDIGIFIDEAYRSWSSNNEDNDDKAINIIVSNSTLAPYWKISDPAMKSLLNLCEDICRRYKFSLKYNGKLAGSNLTKHSWFFDTICPGPFISEKFSDIVTTVNQRLSSPNKLKYVQNPNVISTSYEVIASGDNSIDSELINYNNVNPYIVAIDRNAKSVNYKQLKELDVFGIMIDGGNLYDSIHRKVDYANPNMASQIKGTLDNGLQYGLYFKVSSTTVSEAEAEISNMQRVLRKYIPTLGVWLKLNLSASKSVNDAIIDKYRVFLEKSGWKYRFGIYATRRQLDKISWKSKWRWNMYLWLDDKITSQRELDNIDQLLTPKFFEV